MEMTEQNKKTRSSQQAGDMEGFLKELGRDAIELGLALGKAAEDLTGLMIIQANGDLRSRLDMLVDSGAVKTRAEALKMLYESGMAHKDKIFSKIADTCAQIEMLKKQMRESSGNR
jgi:hypothetical protein